MVGVARARDISNRKELSPSTIRRMVSFFARHEVDKKGKGFSPGEEGYPSNGRIAWALWGGDAGMSWANQKSGQLDRMRDKSRDSLVCYRDSLASKDCVSSTVKKMLDWRLGIPMSPIYEHGTLKRKIALAAATTDQSASQKRKESGNYQKGRFRDSGLEIVIESPRGSIRKGVDKSGKAWQTLMNYHYGYVAKTVGADGDGIDCFLGDDLESEKVFVIDQVVDGEFDEVKSMLYFPNKEAACRAYKSCYEPGWDGLGNVTEMDWDEFRNWCKSADCKQPASMMKFDIAKAFELNDKMFLYGAVLIPGQIDYHENWADEDEIRKACRSYMDRQQGGLQHKVMVKRDGMRLTQNFVAPVDFEKEGLFIRKGSWVVEFEISDDKLKNAIRTGKYTGFSIGGKAKINPENRPDGMPYGSGPGEFAG